MISAAVKTNVNWWLSHPARYYLFLRIGHVGFYLKSVKCDESSLSMITT